jgi:hypothetical protein
VATGAVVLALVGGCGGWAPDPVDDPPGPVITLPPERGVLSYQLGGGYEPPPWADLVARDSTDEPAEGLYSICYVNGFQTQPGADLDAVDALLLHDGDERVVDPEWPDEVLYDTSSPENRGQLAELVARTFDVCAEKGFDAVDLDNLDSFTRSRGLLDLEDNADLANLLSQEADERGLALGQKNAAEHTGAFGAYFDFALVEECAQYDECGTYLDAYDRRVYAVEYTHAQDVPFGVACGRWGDRIGLTLRDRDLLAPGGEEHVEQRCG